MKNVYEYVCCEYEEDYEHDEHCECNDDGDDVCDMEVKADEYNGDDNDE